MKKQIKNSLIGLVVSAVGFVILNGLVTSGILNQYFAQLMIVIGINIILAVSLNLVIGFTGQLALGHAGFMSVGAYAAAILTLKLHAPFPIVLIAGGLMASIFGLIIGIPTLRLKGDYLAVSTLGFGEIIRVVIVNIDYLGGPRGLPGISKETTFLWVYAITILIVLAIYNIIHSTHGRAMISVREDEIASESMGINTTIAKVAAFVIASFFAGIAGGLYGHYFMFIDPLSFNWLKSIDIVIFVVAGGMGSLTGSIFSAIALTLLPEALRLIGLQQYRMLVWAILLLLLMLFRPQGLMGSKELSLKAFGKLSFKKAGGVK